MQISTVKQIAQIVVGSSVSFTVSRALAANTPTTSQLQTAERFVGSMATGWFVADQLNPWIDAKVDSIHAVIVEVRKQIAEKK